MTTATHSSFQPQASATQQTPIRPEVSNDSRSTQNQIPISKLSRPLLLTVLILTVMAIGATIAALAVLKPSMMLLGIFVAFLMMSFIGMPLILASIGDAAEKH